MPISAAFSTCCTLPPSTSHSAPAAIEQATPTFALAADFGAGDRGVFLVQNADGGGGEQKAHHAVFVRAGDKAHVVMQHRRNDPGRTVGGRGDHAPAVGVFFVDGQGVEVDPVEHRQRIAQADLGSAQLAMQRRGAALDLQAARQDAFVAAAGGDAVLHHLPDFQQAGAGFGSGRQALSLVSITWLIDSP
jgi:hypothetical protein